MIKRIIKEEIENLGKWISKEEFCKRFNIEIDEYGDMDISELGSGDFGTAYQINDDLVLKITGSNKEFSIAKELVGKDNYDGFAKYYFAEIVNGEKYIVLEYLEEDSDIESLYSLVEELCNEQGIPLQYVHYLDLDEIEEIDEDVVKFISDLEDINHSYRMLGIEASDLKPDNFGYDKTGKMKAFDIMDKR